MSAGSQNRSGDFLKISGQFKFGALVIEASLPVIMIPVRGIDLRADSLRLRKNEEPERRPPARLVAGIAPIRAVPGGRRSDLGPGLNVRTLFRRILIPVLTAPIRLHLISARRRGGGETVAAVPVRVY